MEIHLSDHFTYKKLLRFTFPAVIMMIFTSLYGIVDGLFVSNYAGKTALAAINFVYPILIILSTFGYMFGTGGSALVAKTMGEGKKEEANRLFSLFVYICFFLGVVFTVLGIFLLKPLMAHLGAEGEMLQMADMYGKILLLSMPFWNLQFAFQMFFVTAERPKLGLYVTLLAGFTNILLDAVFVALFDMGLLGAALATAASQIVGGGVPLLYFFRKNGSLLHLGKTRFEPKPFLKGLLNGLSEFVNGISGSLVSILYNTQLLRYAGEDGVAAYGIMMYITLVFIGISFGYANGTSPVIGYQFGAKNTYELRSLLRKSVVITFAAAALMVLTAEIFAAPFSSVFAGYDAALCALTTRGLRIFATSFLFSGFAIFGASFFTALNNGPVSALLSTLRTLVFQVVTALVLPFFWGVDGIWISLSLAEALAAVLSGVFIFALRKKYNYM